MHLVPLLIACALGGPASGDAAQKEPLSNDDLRRINQMFVQTQQFEDNEFLHEEKLAEAAEKAKRFEGRPVRIEMRVNRVTKENVDVTFFPAPEEVDEERTLRERARTESNKIVPHIEFLGGTTAAGRDGGLLRVPQLVSVELARQLRRGDRLVITGRVQSITPTPSDRFFRDRGARRSDAPFVARVVVTEPKVQKAADSADDDGT